MIHELGIIVLLLKHVQTILLPYEVALISQSPVISAPLEECVNFILSSLSNHKMTTGITLKDYAKTTLTQQQRNESENELHRSSTCLQRRGAPAQIAPWEISDNTLHPGRCSINWTMKQKSDKFLPFHHTIHPGRCSSNWIMNQQSGKFLPFHHTFHPSRCSSKWTMKQQIGKFLPLFLLNLNLLFIRQKNQQNLSIAVCALLTMSRHYLQCLAGI